METTSKKKDNLFVIGLVLVIAGYIVCLIIPYGLVFGTPIILLIGIILTWLSNKSKLYKILITVLPFILWFPGFFIINYFGNRMTPETFLIPENFRGKIILYYDEPCGQEIEKVNDRLIYNIPENGIMILKNKFEGGIINQEYYLIDKKGNKKEKLKMLIQQDFNEDYTLEKNKHEPPRNQVAVFLTGTGTQGMTNGKEIRTHSMYVGSWDSLRVLNDQEFYDMGFNLVQSCRGNLKK